MVSYSAGVREILLSSASASWKSRINPPYKSWSSNRRAREIFSSVECASLDPHIAPVHPFEKYDKHARANVLFDFMTEFDAANMKARLHWIPHLVENKKILNIGMMKVLSTLRARCKGTSGYVGGNVNTLIESWTRSNPDSNYEPVIVLTLKQDLTGDYLEDMLRSKRKVEVDIVLGMGMPALGGDGYTSLCLLAHGMLYLFNDK
jgi:hypothetical protein